MRATLPLPVTRQELEAIEKVGAWLLDHHLSLPSSERKTLALKARVLLGQSKPGQGGEVIVGQLRLSYAEGCLLIHALKESWPEVQDIDDLTTISLTGKILVFCTIFKEML